MTGQQMSALSAHCANAYQACREHCALLRTGVQFIVYGMPDNLVPQYK